MKLLISLLVVTYLFSSNAQEPECSSEHRRIISRFFEPKDIRKIKVAFFDADSTIRVSLSGSVSANTPTDVKLLPFMTTKLNELIAQNYLIYVVSNQGGVAERIIPCETADSALKYTLDLVNTEGALIHGYDFAEFNNENRKPKIGMAQILENILKRKFGANAKIDKANSLMIGDSAYKKNLDLTPQGKPGTHFSNSDRLFAENYQIPFVEASIFFGWREFGIDVFTSPQQIDNFVLFCKKNVACSQKLMNAPRNGFQGKRI